VTTQGSFLLLLKIGFCDINRGAKRLSKVGDQAESAASLKGMGFAIRALRGRRRLAETDLEAKADLAPSSLRLIVSGKVEFRWATLRRLAAGSNIPLDSLTDVPEGVDPRHRSPFLQRGSPAPGPSGGRSGSQVTRKDAAEAPIDPGRYQCEADSLKL
jgi:transcriptional regulator with XRE-family HTH domain